MPPLELLSDIGDGGAAAGMDRASLADGAGLAPMATPVGAKADVSVDLVDLLGGDLLGGGPAPVLAPSMAQPSPDASGGGVVVSGGGGGGDLLDLLGGGGPSVSTNQGLDDLGSLAAPSAPAPRPPGNAKALLSSMLDESLFSTPTHPQQMGGTQVPLGGVPQAGFTPSSAPQWGQAGGQVQPGVPVHQVVQAFPPILAFRSSQSGLTLQFSFAKPNPAAPNVTVITVTSTNMGAMEITRLNVQVAVPKFMQLVMRPPSGDTLRVGAGVSQLVEVNNSMHGTKQLAVKLKIDYVCGGAPVSELTTVSSFPPGL